jgi:multidrug efflux system outer membrane protein
MRTGSPFSRYYWRNGEYFYMTNLARHFFFSIFIFITGCAAMGPDYQRPPITTPETYRSQIDAPEAASFADLPWWEVFQDAALKDLIEEAVKNNYDLRIAATRIEQARARAGIAHAEFFPQIGYQGAIGQAHTAAQFFVPVPSGQTKEVFAGFLNLAWELDVWGRIRRSNEAALADLFASAEFRRGIVLTLVSAVAQAYFELRELDLELAIARRTTDSFQQTLDLFTKRLQLGAASKLETARAEAALATTAANIPNLERRITAKENEISILLGRTPGPIARGMSLTEQIVPPKTPPGLPSQLLERRPDIRQAEQTLVAANALIGVAKANFFPRIGLTSFYGGASSEIENVVKGTGNIWAATGQIAGPIFQGGRLYENYRGAIAQWEGAQLQYRQSVITALQEVSDALINQQKLAEVQENLGRAVAALQESVRLSTLRYTSGLAEYFEVIEAQQQLFPTEIALAQVRRDQLTAVVQLYRALGGGWSMFAEQPQGPTFWPAGLP